MNNTYCRKGVVAKTPNSDAAEIEKLLPPVHLEKAVVVLLLNSVVAKMVRIYEYDKNSVHPIISLMFF